MSPDDPDADAGDPTDDASERVHGATNSTADPREPVDEPTEPLDDSTDPVDDPDGPADDRPDRPPGRSLLAALAVRRNVAVGLATGLALAALAYAVRVFELLGPFRGTREFPVLGVEGYFLLLAFVLAFATAFLVTAVLVAARAVRLARGP